MGCAPSKEQQLRSSKAKNLKTAYEPSTATANKATAAAATSKGINFREPSVVVKDQRVELLPARKLANGVKSNVRNVAHHVKNIFATPFDNIDWNSYVTAQHPKSKTDEALIKTALKNNFVFEHLSPKEIQPLILAFEAHSVEKDEEIIKQGDKGEYFYIIQEGSVIFKVDGKEVGKAPAGASFGELALMYSCPRAATVVAAENTKLLRVDQKTFRFILRKQTMEGADEKVKLLRNVPFLKDLAISEIGKLADVMTPYRFTKDQVIFKKGDKGDNFYIVEEGTLVAKNIGVGQSTYEDMELGPGAYAGERAIITGEARAADLVAKTDGMAFVINKDTFAEVLGSLEEVILRSTDARQLGGMRIIIDSDINTKTLEAMAKLVVDKKYDTGKSLFKAGASSAAALYLIRSGKIEVVGKDGSKEVYERGGYIGHDTLTADCKGSMDNKDATVTPDFTATVIENCTCGVLTLKDLRKIINTKNLGDKGASKMSKSMRAENIKLDDLTSHALLGAGTFGKVWLVSRASSSESNRRAYALKVQTKYELWKDGQAKAVVNEQSIMARIDHPFIIKLVRTYQDTDFVYMLLEIVQGGELYSYIHSKRHDGVPEGHARFYSACIAEGLAYMHRLQVVYRDLKPENVLIDDKGYCVIVDLGFAKYITDKTYTLCGTPLYLAPEIILNRGHNWSADFFSMGVLVFEMIFGETPFFQDGMQQMDLFRAIVKCQYSLPPNGCSPDAASMIDGLLQKNPNKRLGSLKGGEDDIYDHPWFAQVDFDKLRHRQIKAPKVPKIADPLDHSNFENWSHLADDGKKKYPKLSPEQDAIFEDF